MNNSLVSKCARILVIVSLGLALVGCGAGPSGKYVNGSGTFQVDFHSGKAVVSMMGRDVSATYKNSGDRVILHNDRMGNLTLVRGKDGSLRAGYPVGVLRRVKTNSSLAMAQSYGGSNAPADAAAGGLMALMGGSILFFLLVLAAIYVYMAVSLAVIARKTNHGNQWMAWVPILNLILMLNVAEKPLWWILLLLIPLVNIVILVIVWMAIAKARNKPDWWGIAIIVPVLNFVLPGVLAFTD